MRKLQIKLFFFFKSHVKRKHVRCPSELNNFVKLDFNIENKYVSSLFYFTKLNFYNYFFLIINVIVLQSNNNLKNLRTKQFGKRQEKRIL